MGARVDPELCIGCGLCARIAPSVFEVVDHKTAVALLTTVPEELYEDVLDAAESCPTVAILIDPNGGDG